MSDDLNRLNERLTRAHEQRARAQKLQGRVAQLEAERKACADQVSRLAAEVAKEEGDVQRLEGASLTGLFYAMLGSKDERLYKERQEALAARLKHEEAVKRLEALDRDLSQVRSEWAQAAVGTDEYKAVMEEKERFIASEQGRGAAELIRLGEEVAQWNWELQQLKEAHSAGLRADSALADVLDSLEGARGWGTWDMLGGGMIATAMKHDKMDEARSQVHYAQQALAAFQRELKDVTMAIHVDVVNLDGFSRFADYFFDGLIADWAVQNQINQSLESVQQARHQVASLLSQVSHRTGEAQAKLKEIERQRAIFVEQYQG
ncbi:MAG TPA: hypothetical protein VK464_20605 [Symbiobacteriaceae bacterium]|nr:hypothetical protein [Symbiobacteriaceae bacterium]